MKKHDQMVSLYGGATPNKVEKAASDLIKRSTCEVVDNYRKMINIEISMGNMAGAIKAANYLKIYLERRKTTLEEM